jgi:hypothetical protein
MHSPPHLPLCLLHLRLQLPQLLLIQLQGVIPTGSISLLLPRHHLLLPLLPVSVLLLLLTRLLWLLWLLEIWALKRLIFLTGCDSVTVS